MDSNGPDVVDQFYAADNITIPANGQAPISIDWNIPAYAASGEYKIATVSVRSIPITACAVPCDVGIIAGNEPQQELSRSMLK